jgi:hypothetical protein
MKMLASALFASALLFSVAPASAATIGIAGGTTTVALDAGTLAALTGAGITVAPLGTASIMGTSAMFPITGGTIDDVSLDAEIFHDGSGLSLSSMMTTLDLMNFVINVNLGTETGVLTGDAMGAVNASDVPLFNIGPGLVLTLTSEGAGALTAAFGLPDLTGAVIGTASVNVEPVPEPSSIALFGAGAVLIGVLRRKLA